MRWIERLNPYSMNVAVAAAIVTFVAIVLFRLARRGWRVDDHPVCRRCGFDLFGLPKDRVVCPECGRNITGRRAVRLGNRSRHPRLAAFSALMLLCGVIVLGAAGWHAARHEDWQRRKPVWVLRSNVASHNTARRDAAIVELARRLKGGLLSSEQASTVADRILAVQGDEKQSWTAMMGDWIELARDAGKVSDAQWARYGKQAFALRLEVRKRVRRGDLIPAQIVAAAARAGSSRRLGITFVNGRFNERIPVPASGRVTSTTASGGATWPRVFDVSQFGPLKDGPQSMTFAADFVISDRLPKPEAMLVQEPATLTADWVLQPEEMLSVALKPDEVLRQRVQSTIKVFGVRIERKGSAAATVAFCNVRLPTPLACEVWLRRGAVEWRMDQEVFLGEPGTARGSAVAIAYAPADQVKVFLEPNATVDVVLRPSVAAASRTVDLLELLDGDIVVPNVPVKSSSISP